MSIDIQPRTLVSLSSTGHLYSVMCSYSDSVGINKNYKERNKSWDNANPFSDIYLGLLFLESSARFTVCWFGLSSDEIFPSANEISSSPSLILSITLSLPLTDSNRFVAPQSLVLPVILQLHRRLFTGSSRLRFDEIISEFPPFQSRDS